jgi:hypothetical protein
MRRTFLILLIISSCALPLLAQNNNDTKPAGCTLPLARAPELRGLRLGVPQAGVLATFPGTSLGKPDKFGRTQLRLTVIDSSAISAGLPSRNKVVEPDMTSAVGNESAFIIDSARFTAYKGTRRIRLGFLDGRLTFTEVAYDDSIKWDTIDEFVATVAKALNLSAEWSLPPDSDASDLGRELRCDGFVITGSIGADSSDTRIGARLSVEDLSATKTVEKRQEDLKSRAERDEDAKRKNFRP